MKKPFNQTKFGKVVTSAPVRTALGFLPFGVGSAANELLSFQPKQPEGHLQSDRWIFHVIKLSIYAVLLYMLLSGKIDMEQATQAKEFITE
jgi:hypothetical protein